MEEIYKEDIRVVIEESTFFDDEDVFAQKSVLYVNGDLIESNGDHITALLEYLGFNVTVDYI